MEFIKEHWLFILIIVCGLTVYYIFIFKILKSKDLNNINKNYYDIKNSNIFASNESEGEYLSHDHLDARLHNPDAEKKQNWQDALDELNDASSDIIGKNRLNETLDQLGIKSSDDSDDVN